MKQAEKNQQMTVRKQETVRKIVLFMLDNPHLTREEIATAFGIHYNTLCAYLRDSQILKTMRGYASRKVLSMVPLAVKGFEDSLKSGNDKIKYFASKDLLQSEKILGADRVDVTIIDNSQRSIEEMQAVIKEAQGIPSPTIDAEIIE